MDKKIILLLSMLAILFVAGCIGNQSKQVRTVPLTYEDHVEYTTSNGITTENIHIKNTDIVGGTFEIILYVGKNGQESNPRYIDAGSRIVFEAAAFGSNRDTTYPPVQYSIKAPTKTITE